MSRLYRICIYRFLFLGMLMMENSCLAQQTNAEKGIESTQEVISISDLDRKIAHRKAVLFEAPNWTPDGNTLIDNSSRLRYKVPVQRGIPELITTGSLKKVNNGHGISLDGTQLAISDQTETGKSLNYVLPITVGVPKKRTPKGPSYWHGWSPDGKTLAYCAERNGNYDIYTIPLKEGKEERSTSAEGLDDDSDYTPDGSYIYFNSKRTGTIQVWRLKTDGSQQEQVTEDKFNDWFQHPSPNGNGFFTSLLEPMCHLVNTRPIEM